MFKIQSESTGLATEQENDLSKVKVNKRKTSSLLEVNQFSKNELLRKQEVNRE
jgi:hypothetical protein